MEAPCSLTTKTCTGRSNCWCVTKFSVSAGSSVTDGDGLYLVSFNHFAEFRSRFSFFVYRRGRIDVFIVYEIALCIEADHLITGAKAGIDTHYPFLSQGWGKKQLAQVFGKDPDRFVIGLCFY